MDFRHGDAVSLSDIIDRPVLEFETVAFNGDVTDARTGREVQFYGVSRSQVLALLQAMEPGDSLVINAATH